MEYTKNLLDSFIESIPEYPKRYQGKGIVISSGGSYLPSSYIAIRSIRQMGCSLPIQLWHIGEAELPAVMKPIFETHGVSCIDSQEVAKIHPIKKLGGWQNKIFSILYSPFEEVLLIDADNMVLRDPTYLFDDVAYRQFGNLFWPDFLYPPDSPWAIKPFAWDFLALQRKEGAELESGQLLIHKALSWVPLCTALHMNSESDFYYERCTYGDKDTYRLAWEYLKQPLHCVTKRPTLLEDMVRVQFDPSGKAVFQHARKWVLPASKNPALQSYALEGECRSWLKEFEQALIDLGFQF